MSIAVMTQVWSDAPVDGNKLLILLALADWCNDDGHCYPAYQTLADKARVGKSTAIRCVKSLEEMGLIRVERNKGRSNSNLYILCLDRMKDIKGVKMTPPLKGVKSDVKGVKSPLKGVTRDTQTKNRHIEPCVAPSASHTQNDLFNEFWDSHPRPRDEHKTRKAWDQAITSANPHQIIQGAKEYAKEQEGNLKKYIAYSDTWLLKLRWKEYTGEAPKPLEFRPNPITIEKVKNGEAVEYFSWDIAQHYIDAGLLTFEQCEIVLKEDQRKTA